VGHFPGPGGDLLLGFHHSIEGARQGGQLTIEYTATEQATPLEPIFATVAVFRYTGDPNQIDGLEVSSVAELIELGLITEDDVFFEETFPLLQSMTDTFVVDVADVPDTEIVTFQSMTQDTAAVPAVSDRVALALALAALAALTVFVRRRQSSAGRDQGRGPC
jgi:hypothetical protein